jgi:hypothetical protein
MYAIIRKNTYDPGKLARAGPALAEFQALHAAQPGYAGSIDVDTGHGHRIIVNLWHTEQRRPRRAGGARLRHDRPAACPGSGSEILGHGLRHLGLPGGRQPHPQLPQQPRRAGEPELPPLRRTARRGPRRARHRPARCRPAGRGGSPISAACARSAGRRSSPRISRILVRRIACAGATARARSSSPAATCGACSAAELRTGTYVDLMAQYYPAGLVGTNRRDSYEEINRHLARGEYDRAATFASELGLSRLDERSRASGLQLPAVRAPAGT